jgi:hypothetical protein
VVVVDVVVLVVTVEVVVDVTVDVVVPHFVKSGGHSNSCDATLRARRPKVVANGAHRPVISLFLHSPALSKSQSMHADGSVDVLDVAVEDDLVVVSTPPSLPHRLMVSGHFRLSTFENPAHTLDPSKMQGPAVPHSQRLHSIPSQLVVTVEVVMVMVVVVDVVVVVVMRHSVN